MPIRSVAQRSTGSTIKGIFVNATQFRSVVGEQAGRVTRAIARRRRLQLLIAMMVGLIIGLTSMAMFGGGVSGEDQHHGPAAVSDHPAPGQDRDND